MRAKTINFERGADIKRSANLGINRKMPDDLLRIELFNKIWPKVRLDPFFLEDGDEEFIKKELEDLISTLIEEGLAERPSDVDESVFREYWTDVYKA